MVYDEITITLSYNHVYILTIFNNYNVGGVYILQTGSTSGSGKCVITALMPTTYFSLTAVSGSSFTAKGEGASGYLYAYRLA